MFVFHHVHVVLSLRLKAFESRPVLERQPDRTQKRQKRQPNIKNNIDTTFAYIWKKEKKINLGQERLNENRPEDIRPHFGKNKNWPL